MEMSSLCLVLLLMFGIDYIKDKEWLEFALSKGMLELTYWFSFYYISAKIMYFV